MAMLTVDCVRCGERKMTHDVQSCGVYNDQGGTVHWEYCLQCRACNKSAVWRVDRYGSYPVPSELIKRATPIDEYIDIIEAIRPRGASEECPEYTPADLKVIFDEGANCMSIGAWNAASAMFRKIVDQISKDKMSAAEVQPPDNRTRFNLKPRLMWLFANNLLPTDIEALADAIREDGNDGVHNAPLSKDDALDVQDFTVELLERLYTVPGRLQAAEERRAQRRARPT
jgi:hypothetical protein